MSRSTAGGVLAPVRLGVLGSLEATVEDRTIDLGSPKQRAALALLALQAPLGLTVEGMIDGLWGEAAPEAAPASVYSYVSNLKTLMAGGIERRRGAYTLTVPLTSDGAAFEAAVDHARQVLHVTPGEAATVLSDALSTWRGFPYADLIDTPGLQDEIRRLDELRRVAVEMRIDAQLALGRGNELLPELRALVIEFPLAERFRAQLMLALYRSGRQAEALREYGRLRELLVGELGIDPSPELQDLELRILQQDETLSAGEGRVVTQRLAFLVAGIPKSTRLWDEHGDSMAEALARYDAIVETAVNEADGTIVKRTGDGTLSVFPRVDMAARAAEKAQQALHGADWSGIGELRVSMAIDYGDVEVRDGTFTGPPLTRCARILGLAHGDQVLLSSSAFDELSTGERSGVQIKQLGSYLLDGFGDAERLAQLVVAGLPTDFPEPPTEAPPHDVSTRLEVGGLPGYELRERLDVGPWGSVYRAYQPAVGREVAIRAISAEVANDPTVVRGFEARAREIGKLEHPHIVPVLDFWRGHDGAYLVMQYMRGGSLARRVHGGPSSAAEVIRIIGQVGAALAYAHEEGLAHGAIRPESILLDGGGNAYVSGFGLGNGLIGSPHVHQGHLAESPYLSPEARIGSELERRSDVFSLAVVAHVLLTGVEPPVDEPLPPLPMSSGSSQHDLHGVFLRATAKSPEDRFDGVPDFLEALETALEVDNLPERSTFRTEIRNPFKGLRPFMESDAGDFHGRTELIDSIVEMVGGRRFVSVVGPSGSGKSSVVHAGLIPRIRFGALPRSEAWYVTSFTPGAHPLSALASALRPLATVPLGDIEGNLRAAPDQLGALLDDLLPSESGDVVMVVDQFEELFTLTVDTAERDLFVEVLASAVASSTSRLRVVLTLRADFYDRPLEYPVLASLVSDGSITVIPPTTADLIAAIERPALAVGLALEPGLSTRIASDLSGQPGGLPLLQYALTEMVERRTSDLLTTGDYEAIGGVRGAVARRAESVFSNLDETEQGAARSILLRLVSVEEEASDSRRRVRLGELADLAHHERVVSRVLDAFGVSRLLSFNRDPVSRSATVEVAHEALLSEWGRLRSWINKERDRLILTRRLRAAMVDWQDSGRNEDYLLVGERLAPFLGWTDSDRLTRVEGEFLRRSVDAEKKKARRKRWGRRLAITSLVVVTVITSILAMAAFQQSERANREAERATALAEQESSARLEAEQQSDLAEAAAQAALEAEAAASVAESLSRARELAAAAIGVDEFDPQLAILLTLEAVAIQPEATEMPVELQKSLRQAVHSNRLELVVPLAIPASEASRPRVLMIAAHGNVLTVGQHVYSSETWEPIWHFGDETADAMAISADSGGVVIQQYGAGELTLPATIHVISLPDGTPLQSMTVDCAASAAALSLDETLLALHEHDCDDPMSSTAMLRVYDLATGKVIHNLPVGNVLATLGFVGEADDGFLVYSDRSSDMATRVLDAATFEEITAFADVGAVSTDGLFISITRFGGPPTLFDVTTGEVIDRLDGLGAEAVATQVGAGYFSPDGSRVIVPNEGSSLPVWDVATGALEFEVPAGQGVQAGFVNANTLVTLGADGHLKVWDLSVEATGELNTANVASIFQTHGIESGDHLGAAWTFDWEAGRGVGWLFDPKTGVLGEQLADTVSFWPAISGDAGILYLTPLETDPEEADQRVRLRWLSAVTGEPGDVGDCPPDGGWACPAWNGHIGMTSSVDGTEAGFLSADGTFRVWRDGPEPVEEVVLSLHELDPSSLIMSFTTEWVVVRRQPGWFDVFDRSTGDLETSFEMEGQAWLHFDRSGSVGIGSGFSKTLSVVSTEDWTIRDLTADLGEGIARGIAVSPSGDRVAVGVMDGFVRIFELGTGLLVDIVPIDRVVALDWLDDSHIAVGTRDGLWTVLTLDPAELVSLARDELRRDFTANECALYRIESCRLATGD